MGEADIDPALLARAFRAPNGELAWSSVDVWEAIDTLQRSDLAILGGEVWAVSGGNLLAMPRLASGQSAVIAWGTDERRAEEAWPEFVARTAAESRSRIRAMNPEEAVAPELREKLYYNFCYVAASAAQGAEA